MEFSAAIFFKLSPDGQETIDFEAFNNPELIDKYDFARWKRFEGLNTCIKPVNKVCRSFMESQLLPIRACRLISSKLLGAIPRNNWVFKSSKEYLVKLVKDRHSVPPAHFQSRVDNYKCLTEPFDVLRRKISLSICGYDLLKTRHLYACVFVGYEGVNSQDIIDTLYQTTDSFSSVPRIKKLCVKKLRNICDLHNAPPTAMQIEVPDIQASVAQYGGGFAKVFKCTQQDTELAVKVLEISALQDPKKASRRYYKEAITWKFLRHPNVLPLLGVPKKASGPAFAMVSEWMKNGRINNYVREHPDINRLKLLADVAQGLVYVHAQGIVHGDLKGDNILIDDSGNARIADFGLLVVLDSMSSREEGGSTRWMSPELLDPDMFHLEKVPRTRSSDCYGLGMVIYEVLSGHLPFHDKSKHAAIAKALDGTRPKRPMGLWFTDEIWDLLQHCWKHEPSDRPSVDHVLESLTKASDAWTPPSSPAMDPQTDDSSSEHTSSRISTINIEA